MSLPVHERAGSGPPLFLLHATLSSSYQLRALAARLAQHFSVISVDRRGSGRSTVDGPVQPVDVAIHVADLAEIADAGRLGPAVVVGHSYGGCVALELAARHPGLARAVIAYEPPYGPVAPPDVQAHMADVARRTLEANEQGGPAAAALAFMAGVSGPAAVAALGPAARERIGRAGAGAVAEATLAGLDPAGLGDIGCPVRLLGGSSSDDIYTHIAKILASHIQGASHVRLDGLDHMAPVTRPDAIAAAVEDFVLPMDTASRAP